MRQDQEIKVKKNKQIIKKWQRSRDVAPWQSTCQSGVRPWFPASKRGRKGPGDVFQKVVQKVVQKGKGRQKEKKPKPGAACFPSLLATDWHIHTSNLVRPLAVDRRGGSGDSLLSAPALTSMPRLRKPIMHRRHLNVKLS